jgi:hypothetical protein
MSPVADPFPVGAGKNSPPPAPAPDTSATTTPSPGTSQAQTDAITIITTELTSWGFGQDAIDWATQQIQSNNSVDQVIYSMRQQPFYINSIFGEVAAARSAAGLPAMTEAQILAYKDSAIGVAQQAGLPPGFMTDQQLTELMGNDVSASELDARITQGYVQAMKSDPAVLHELKTYYGVTPGHLAAYWLDPKSALPILQQQFQSAQIGAQANKTGWGQLTEQQAHYLAQLGVTDAQAKTGFTDLAKQAQLFTSLPGTSEEGVSLGVQLGAEFGGNAADIQAIQRAAQQRAAVFAGNFHYAETQNKGITGLGSVQRNG